MSRNTIRKNAQRTVDGNPFHNINILGQHHDGLEVPIHQRGVSEWTAEIQWSGALAMIARRWGVVHTIH